MSDTETITYKAFKVLGSTDDVTQCECCGRSDLKATVILGILDEGGAIDDVTYFGSSCGARAAGWTIKELRAKVSAADRAAAEAARIERERLENIESARIRSLDGTAECYVAPSICRRTRKGKCVAHPA